MTQQLDLRFPLPPRAEPKPFDHRLVGVLSADAYELLDGLERWAEVRINSKVFRYVAGDAPENKLFWLRNRPPGLKQLFTLVEAAPFAMRGELVPANPRGYQDVPLSALGAVHPMLSDYEGFIAPEDCIEVRKDPTSKKATPSWFVPVSRLGEFPPELVVRERDGSPKILKAGSFGLRVPSRSTREGSAYYTPDELAECLTRYTLQERLKDVKSADELLSLTLCDPCMGANAIFLMHAVNQLAHEYLERKQRELGQLVPSASYEREVSKVKQHLVAHQCYGVELDPAAAEMGRTLLWLSTGAGLADVDPEHLRARRELLERARWLIEESPTAQAVFAAAREAGL